MSYRRFRKKTKVVTAKYTEIIDLQTVAGKTSVIGIHCPSGWRPINRLSGLYSQYRFVKYRGCKVKMIPAQNLPVDPLGLTGIVGTTDTMDPRDALNPILYHGCHGEHLGQILDNIYANPHDAMEESESANKLELDNAVDEALSRYYQCLTDTSWGKSGIQSPFQKSYYPLVNRLVSTVPFFPHTGDFETSHMGMLDYQSNESGDVESATFATETAHTLGMIGQLPEAKYDPAAGVSTRINPQIFTAGLARLGWLPTTTTDESGAVRYQTLPRQFMGVLVLPPAYNVEQFFRMSITHYYAFSGFTTSLGGMEISVPGIGHTDNSYFNWIDYDVTTNDTGSKYVEGSTLDLIDADAKVIADGVR